MARGMEEGGCQLSEPTRRAVRSRLFNTLLAFAILLQGWKLQGLAAEGPRTGSPAKKNTTTNVTATISHAASTFVSTVHTITTRLMRQDVSHATNASFAPSTVTAPEHSSQQSSGDGPSSESATEEGNRTDVSTVRSAVSTQPPTSEVETPHSRASSAPTSSTIVGLIVQQVNTPAFACHGAGAGAENGTERTCPLAITICQPPAQALDRHCAIQRFLSGCLMRSSGWLGTVHVAARPHHDPIQVGLPDTSERSLQLRIPTKVESSQQNALSGKQVVFLVSECSPSTGATMSATTKAPHDTSQLSNERVLYSDPVTVAPLPLGPAWQDCTGRGFFCEARSLTFFNDNCTHDECMVLDVQSSTGRSYSGSLRLRNATLTLGNDSANCVTVETADQPVAAEKSYTALVVGSCMAGIVLLLVGVVMTIRLRTSCRRKRTIRRYLSHTTGENDFSECGQNPFLLSPTSEDDGATDLSQYILH